MLLSFLTSFILQYSDPPFFPLFLNCVLTFLSARWAYRILFYPHHFSQLSFFSLPLYMSCLLLYSACHFCQWMLELNDSCEVNSVPLIWLLGEKSHGGSGCTMIVEILSIRHTKIQTRMSVCAKQYIFLFDFIIMLILLSSLGLCSFILNNVHWHFVTSFMSDMTPSTYACLIHIHPYPFCQTSTLSERKYNKII